MAAEDCSEREMKDRRDKIISDLMNKAINPPIFMHPPSKLKDDIDAYIKGTKRITKYGLREVLRNS